MPRPSTPRLSLKIRSNSPSPQPTSSTLAPRSTISATSTRSIRAPPGVRTLGSTVRFVSAGDSLFIDSALWTQTTCLAGTVEEAAHDREQLRLIEQKGIVTFVGDDLGE